MGFQPKITGKTIERAYEDYKKEAYLVNRRYQRKLVWSLKEKLSFIDSVQNGYPVPLFLFANNSFKGEDRQEIIDGMQRLNALFGYIENEFSLDGKYFDLSSTAFTKQLLDEGQLIQNTPVLDRNSSVKIASYELPFSVYDEDNPEIIDEVFRRINSNGVHLSRQEIRQAGSTGILADLVRELAIEIRGDISNGDILFLNEMKDISIQQDDNNYGINASEVFWVKENIIKKTDLRSSADEEIITDLIASMLLDEIPPTSVKVLDSYFGMSETDKDDRRARIENAIQVRTPDLVKKNFMNIIYEIKNIFNDKDESIINHMFNDRMYYRGPRYFQVLFLSLYELIYNRSMKIYDYDKMYQILDNIADNKIRVSKGGGNWASSDKEDTIKQTVSLLESACIKREKEDPMNYDHIRRIERLLKLSCTENVQYDFKQGLHDIYTEKRNNKLTEKIFKTLSAIGNSRPNSVGYVLIGVADNEKDACKLSNQYGISPKKVGNFYITGVNGEVEKYYNGNYDKYLAKFKESLQNSKINPRYARQIGERMEFWDYYGLNILVLEIESDHGPISYDGVYYTRMGPNNNPNPIADDDYFDFFANFINKDNN